MQLGGKAQAQEEAPSGQPKQQQQGTSQKKMGSFAKHMILCHANMAMHHKQQQQHPQSPHVIRSSSASSSSSSSSSSGADENGATTSRRLAIMSTILAASSSTAAGVIARPPSSRAQSWGTHSFIKEKYFMPEITPEEAVERIRQTTEGLHDMRHMLETMSWRYVLFYVRVKSAYLDSDLKNAMATVPEANRTTYVKVANEVVENMSLLDRYVRTPKVYESYLYYEKALKSLDDLVALLA